MRPDAGFGLLPHGLKPTHHGWEEGRNPFRPLFDPSDAATSARARPTMSIAAIHATSRERSPGVI